MVAPRVAAELGVTRVVVAVDVAALAAHATREIVAAVAAPLAPGSRGALAATSLAALLAAIAVPTPGLLAAVFAAADARFAGVAALTVPLAAPVPAVALVAGVPVVVSVVGPVALLSLVLLVATVTLAPVTAGVVLVAAFALAGVSERVVAARVRVAALVTSASAPLPVLVGGVSVPVRVALVGRMALSLLVVSVPSPVVAIPTVFLAVVASVELGPGLVAALSALVESVVARFLVTVVLAVSLWIRHGETPARN